MKHKIYELLNQCGVPASLNGRDYLQKAIEMAIDDPSLKKNITKRLYPTLASEYGTTPSRVERSIRHAIEVAFDRGNLDFLEHVFGYTIDNEKGKPTNGEFIFMCAEYLKLNVFDT